MKSTTLVFKISCLLSFAFLLWGGIAPDQLAGSHAAPQAVVLDVNASIWDAMLQLENFVGESIPVLEDGRLAGVLFESRIVGAYLGILEEIRREEHAAM